MTLDTVFAVFSRVLCLFLRCVSSLAVQKTIQNIFVFFLKLSVALHCFDMLPLILFDGSRFQVCFTRFGQFFGNKLFSIIRQFYFFIFFFTLLLLALTFLLVSFQ